MQKEQQLSAVIQLELEGHDARQQEKGCEPEDYDFLVKFGFV